MMFRSEMTCIFDPHPKKNRSVCIIMVLLLRLIELSKGKGGRSTPRDTITDWEDYHSYDQIVGYLDEVAATYDFCSTEVIGQSVEGRDLKVLKFERAGPGAKNVWIEASTHALMKRPEQ